MRLTRQRNHEVRVHGRRGSGSALVELVVVTPIMVLLLAELLHIGTTVYAEQAITNASRIGAYRGIQSGASPTVMQAAARSYLRGQGLDPDKLTFNATAGTATTDSRCTLSYPFTSPVQAFADKVLSHVSYGHEGGGRERDARSSTPRTIVATTVMRY